MTRLNNDLIPDSEFMAKLRSVKATHAETAKQNTLDIVELACLLVKHHGGQMGDKEFGEFQGWTKSIRKEIEVLYMNDILSEAEWATVEMRIQGSVVTARQMTDNNKSTKRHRLEGRKQ